MSIKTYIGQRLLGAFELAILMKQGLSRFNGTPKEALFSFSVLLAAKPISYIATTIHKPLGTEDYCVPHIFFTHF